MLAVKGVQMGQLMLRQPQHIECGQPWGSDAVLHIGNTPSL